MIARDMQHYSYYAYGAPNAYGQPTLIKDENGELVIQGSTDMAIYLTSQSIQDNVNYKDCSYVGLTYDTNINDSLVILYGEELLKVQYVNAQGRLNQVFLKKI